MKNDLKLFVEFDKKDNDKREVSGYASTPALDSQGEVVELDAIKNALPGYLGAVDEETGKFRYGNIREMHQMSAVGKTIYARVDDKGLYITGKVVDDDAWKKVKEGVYAGFSIGGKVLESMKNKIKAIKLSEISLVDRPANPDAVFEMVKFDEKGEIVDKQDISTPKPPKGQEVAIATYILELANEIRRMLNVFQAEGKSTVELSTALTSLKNLAVKVLSEKDSKKFDEIVYGIDFEEMNKLSDITEVPAKKEIKKAEIKNYVDHSWTPDYFDNAKKVLG